MLKILKPLFYLIHVIIIIALLAIHFVFKENSYFYSLLYYSFPLPVIIGIILFLSVFLKRKLRRHNLILAGVLLIIWLGRSFKIHFTEDIKETDIEIVFWNASHDRNFEDAFKENDNIPDVLVLVEHGEYSVDDIKQKYPAYYFHRSIRGISVFSKTALNILNETSSKYGSKFMNFETQGINFYAIDVSGSLDVPRQWGLRFINSLIEKTNNTVVLGDFNIPYESMYLDNIKTNFNHAFSEKGNGFRETWFWNIPLLSLDHIWVSKDLKIVKSEKINTFKSDHSMVKAIIRK